jgi:hypothetical protein
MENSEADKFIENVRGLLKLSHISGIVNTKQKYGINQNLSRNKGLRNYELKRSKKSPNNDRPAKIIREIKYRLKNDYNSLPQSSTEPPSINTNSLTKFGSPLTASPSEVTPTLSNFRQVSANEITPVPTEPAKSAPSIIDTIANFFTGKQKPSSPTLPTATTATNTISPQSPVKEFPVQEIVSPSSIIQQNSLSPAPAFSLETAVNQTLNTQPLTNQTLNTQPLTNQPLNTQPLTSTPLTSQSLNTQPLTNQTLTNQPLNSQPFNTQLTGQTLTNNSKIVGGKRRKNNTKKNKKKNKRRSY